MAKNKNSHVHDFIPEFELSSRFCYFLDLYESAAYQHGSLKKAKRNLFADAARNIVRPIRQELSIINNKEQQTETIKNAIKFLQDAAQSERNKEIRIIHNYIDELKKNPIITNIINSKSKNGSNMDTLLQDLENFSQDPNRGDPREFYIKLTILINAIRSEIESFQTRLAQITKDNRTQQEIRSTFAPLRMASDLNSLFKSISGTITREKEDGLAKQTRDLIVNFILKKFKNNTLFIEQPYEFFAAVMIDFEIYLQQYFDKLPLDQQTKLEDLDIEKIFSEYTAQETDLIQNLLEQNKSAYNLLQTIKEQTGLEYKKVNLNNQQKNTNKLNNILKNTEVKKHSANYTKIIKNIGTSKIGPQVSWSLTGSGIHGSIYELVLPVLQAKMSQKIKGHAATDVITLHYGTLNIDINLDEHIKEQLNNIAASIENYAKTQRKNRQDDLIQVINDMNEDLRKAQEEINIMMREAKIPKDIFIYHQSLKLYTTVETHEKNYFHGRTMNILNALDNIYSMNDIHGLSLMNKDIMYNIALNLSSLAVGGAVKHDVENYLSIFAGLLLFDDLQNIALDIGNNAIIDLQHQTQGEVRQIHLYLVNGIYIPGSMLLSTISYALEQGYQHITSDYGANITINTNDIDNDIAQYLVNSNYKTYNIEDWEKYGEKAMIGTKVNIIFLKSFINFLEEIQNYMNNGG